MARSTILEFIAALKSEIQRGHITAQTEHHLRREFTGIGWDRDDTIHAVKVDEEIERLESQARVLRRLREESFGPIGRD